MAETLQQAARLVNLVHQTNSGVNLFELRSECPQWPENFRVEPRITWHATPIAGLAAVRNGARPEWR